MADADRILKILLQIDSKLDGINDVKGGLKETKSAIDDASASAFSLGDAFLFAGAAEALSEVLGFVKQIPIELSNAIGKGIEFAAQLQQTQTAIAGVLRQNAPDFFGDFNKASTTAGDTIDRLKAKANELGFDYESMFEAYTHSVNAMFAGGVTDVQKQIDLTATLSRALTSIGISATQQRRDIADLLTGNASRTIAGRQLAAGMGIDVGEFDRMILAANQLGQAEQFWTKAMAAYQEAGRAASENLISSLNRSKNALIDVENESAKPIMQPLKESIDAVTAALRSDGALAAMETLGQDVASLFTFFANVTNGILTAAAALERFGGAASTVAGTLASLSGIPGLGAVVDGQTSQFLDNLPGSRDQALVTQVNKLEDMARAAKTVQETDSARAAINQEIATLQTRIGEGYYQNTSYANGQLGVLLDLVKNIKAYADTLPTIAARHIANQKAIEAEKQALDEIKILEDTASGDKEAVAADRAALAYDKAYKSLLAANVPEERAKDLAQQIASATQAAALAADHRKDAEKDIAAFLQEESLLVEEIHVAQQAITKNPFLSVDQKDALQIPLIATEIDQLNQKIAAGKALLSGGTLDPAQYDKVSKAVVQLQGQVIQLGFDLQKLSFSGGLQSELVQWANSFGTAAQQVARTITGTLNTAIGSTSQALTGLIFGTQNWKQAFASAAQSIVGDLIKIALQFVVSRLIMAAINKATGAVDATAASAQASTAAAAWAPAATSASIATYGTAAATGVAAYIAALASGEAAAVGLSAVGNAGGVAAGFAKGGFTGTGATDEVAGRVHKMEYVFGADAVRTLGLPFLENLHSAASTGSIAKFGGGGYVTTNGGIRISQSQYDQALNDGFSSYDIMNQLPPEYFGTTFGRAVVPGGVGDQGATGASYSGPDDSLPPAANYPGYDPGAGPVQVDVGGGTGFYGDGWVGDRSGQPTVDVSAGPGAPYYDPLAGGPPDPGPPNFTEPDPGPPSNFGPGGIPDPGAPNFTEPDPVANQGGPANFKPWQGFLGPGQNIGFTPTGIYGFSAVPGETWIGGGVAGIDPVTGNTIYNPLGYGSFGSGSYASAFGGQISDTLSYYNAPSGVGKDTGATPGPASYGQVPTDVHYLALDANGIPIGYTVGAGGVLYGGGGGGGGGSPYNPIHFAIRATGGPIAGGRGGIDDVPALLTAGEYVIRKEAVDYHGRDMLERLNSVSTRGSRFASGGMVGDIGGGGVRKEGATHNHHALFLDPNEARKWLLEQPAGQKHILDLVRRKKLDLGIHSR